MKLLLVSANRERSPYPVFPLGLACIVPPLRAAGHELHALDLCFEPHPPAALAAALDRVVPDAVLVSIRNIDNVTYPGSRSYLDGVREVVGACSSRATVILGGSGFSIMPALLLRHLGGHFGVVGEGEEVLPQLLAALQEGRDPAAVPGVVVAGADTFLPPRPLQHPGPPDRDLFDLQRYAAEGGMANLQTKRGCPFSCIYCVYPLLEGTRMRLRPVAEILEELRGLVEAGITYVYFVDDIFNYPPEFALELCRALARERLPVKWSAFVNPGFMTPQLLQAMAAAGCDGVEYGTESGSAAMLQRLGKSFGPEEVLDASRLCREAGVDFAHYLLLGGPGESAETLAETFALMDEAAPTAVITMTGIRILPGTELQRRAVAEGVVSAEDPLLEPVFYIAAEVRESLCELVTAHALSRRNWVVPGLEVNTSDAMLEAIRHFRVEGPLWKLMKRLGRSRIRPL